MKHLLNTILIASLSLIAMPCLAHGGSTSIGFISGFLHPIFGFDHLMAMLAVGVVSTCMHRLAIYTVPACFVGAMALSAVAAMNGIALSYIELGISLSVFLLGLLLLLQLHTRLSLLTPVIYMAVIIFAVFHGYAHGAEIPQAAKPSSFLLGFVMATALVHGAGILLGRIHQWRSDWQPVVSHFGTAIMSVGGYLSYLYIDNWWG